MSSDTINQLIPLWVFSLSTALFLKFYFGEATISCTMTDEDNNFIPYPPIC